MTLSAKGNIGECVTRHSLGLNPGDSYIISTSGQKRLSQQLSQLKTLSACNANQSKGKGSAKCDCVTDWFSFILFDYARQTFFQAVANSDPSEKDSPQFFTQA